jgi:ubiquinone/menaquinone biosynthesis C-methylase UbiE
MTDQKQHWDELHAKGQLTQHASSETEFARYIQSLIPEKSHLLELGCGAGNDSNYFANNTHTVLATDFSPVAVEQNRNTYSNPNLSFEVLDMSIGIFPFQNETFDVIYARLSLHYFNDKITKQIFKEIHRVLKSGGKLCFMCKSTDEPYYSLGREIEKDMFEYKGHIRHFFSEKYVQECIQGMFEIEMMKSEKEILYGKESADVKFVGKKI